MRFTAPVVSRNNDPVQGMFSWRHLGLVHGAPGQKHDTAIEGDASAVEGGGWFLAPDGWKGERPGGIIVHGGRRGNHMTGFALFWIVLLVLVVVTVFAGAKTIPQG